MVNKEVAQFIRYFAYLQLVNSVSHEAHYILHKIELDTPFEVVFLDFWYIGGIPDWDRPKKVITLWDCMTVYGIVSSSLTKEIISNQVAQWAFGKFFVPFVIPIMIVVDADVLFAVMFKKFFSRP